MPFLDFNGLKEFKATENSTIASVESTTTASKAYNIGDFFWYAGKLYKATAPIASGATITIGTNCSLAPLANDVSALKSAFSNIFYIPKDFTYGWISNVGISKTDGTNTSWAYACRSAYVQFYFPFEVELNLSGYEYLIWVYSGTTGSTHQFSPTNKDFTTGKTVVTTNATGNSYFRICVRLTDTSAIFDGDASDPDSDLSKVIAALKCSEYFETDKTLTVANRAADAKAVGDAIKTDTTLSVSGKSADAKETGDAISALDADVDALGDGIDYKTGMVEIPITESGTIATNGETVDVTVITPNIYANHVVVNCSEHDAFTITGTGGSEEPRLWCFIDDEGNSLAVGGKNETLTNAVLIAPHGAAKLVVNVVIANPHALYTGVISIKTFYDFKRFEDAHATLYPTGDATDRRLEIVDVLNKYGVCYFAPGDYYIEYNISLPDGSKLIGAGKNSRIIFPLLRQDETSVTGQMIDCGKDCQISNLKFDGLADSKPANASANRHGIRVQNNNQTLQIHDCWIVGFAGTGIRIDSTGYAGLTSIQAENCLFQYNGSGISFLEHGEYGLVNNCKFLDNAYGTIVNGGNNSFSNCHFVRNTTGGYVSGNNIDNSGHGAFVGCTFNHNTTNGLQITSTDNGFVVSGCQIFRNESVDLLVNAAGVNVTGCNFGVSSRIQLSANASVQFVGNMFASSPTYNFIEGSVRHGVSNRKFDGTELEDLNV